MGLGANNEITEVKEGSVSAQAGVEAGYILTHVNDECVSHQTVLVYFISLRSCPIQRVA